MSLTLKPVVDGMFTLTILYDDWMLLLGSRLELELLIGLASE